MNKGEVVQVIGAHDRRPVRREIPAIYNALTVRMANEGRRS